MLDHFLRCQIFVAKSLCDPNSKHFEKEADTESDTDATETYLPSKATPGHSNDTVSNEPVAEDDRTSTTMQTGDAGANITNTDYLLV